MIEISDKSKVVVGSLIGYNKNYKNKTYRLVTNNLDVLNIKFPEVFYLNDIGLDDVFKDKKKNKIGNCYKIIECVYKGFLDYFDADRINEIEKQSKKWNLLYPLSVNNVHSIIENGDETYVIQKIPNDFYTVIKLMKNKYNSHGLNKEFFIIDILKLEYLNDLINDDNTTVSFPISSSYIDFNKNKKVKKKLNHIKVDKRIDDFKNLIYFDLNGNVRKQNKDINAYKFVKKVPIRK
ncbi:MAG TPA: hypothetical protein IAB68_04675 [Candidatus Aphodocola excrementigallinarum]|uniref:Uncharacterized protein n=1 Tax=Candidatus Aphodocola excrementigallinarum TaxID=2840670 RepID=A0A9D1IRE5_9FIRM|nr:hypothetical protein [Candidatus Aphodocola excrementigallinarum]